MNRVSRALRLALLAALLSTNHLTATAAQAPAVGASAPVFELKTLDGRAAGLEVFRGKALVLHFFASWCDPCRDEIPIINTLAAKADRGAYRVLGVAVQDTRASVTDFARELKIAFPIALDLDSQTHRAYRIFGPPATVFIDGQGVLRDMVLGPMTPERAHAGLAKTGINEQRK